MRRRIVRPLVAVRWDPCICLYVRESVPPPGVHDIYVDRVYIGLIGFTVSPFCCCSQNTVSFHIMSIVYDAYMYIFRPLNKWFRVGRASVVVCGKSINPVRTPESERGWVLAIPLRYAMLTPLISCTRNNNKKTTVSFPDFPEQEWKAGVGWCWWWCYSEKETPPPNNATARKERDTYTQQKQQQPRHDSISPSQTFHLCHVAPQRTRCMVVLDLVEFPIARGIFRDFPRFPRGTPMSNLFLLANFNRTDFEVFIYF